MSIHYTRSLNQFVVLNKYQKLYFESEMEENFKKTKKITRKDYYKMVLQEDVEVKGELLYIIAPQIHQMKYNDLFPTAYDPLIDAPELYTELNKIALFDEKSLMKFIKHYGLPSNESIQERTDTLKRFNYTVKEDEIKCFPDMDVIIFNHRLKKYKKCFKLYEDIQNNHLDHLTEVTEEFEEYIKGYFIGPEKIAIWNKVKNQSLIKQAKAYLHMLLNEGYAGRYASKYLDDDNGYLVPALIFNDLIEVAYYQLSQAIFKDAKLIKCDFCGGLFEPTDSRQHFCPKKKNEKRSSCENTFNQREKRKRAKGQK